MTIHKTESRIDREGVFTDSRIEAGAHVHTMGGELISLHTLYWRVYTGKLRCMDDIFVLGHFHFLVLDELSLAFNHSCDPNCGFRNARDLHAIRPIEPGEEITFDYSLNASGIVWWRMSGTCACGAANCRGTIGNIATIPEAAYRRYLDLGVVPKKFQISRRFRIAGRQFGI